MVGASFFKCSVKVAFSFPKPILTSHSTLIMQSKANALL
jgi:hypothetical protein